MSNKSRITRYLLLLAFLCSFIPSYSQFVPSSSTEYAYPSNVLNGRTKHSSCIKFGNLVLSAWDEMSMGGQVIWQVLNGSNLPICQGTIGYSPGITEIEVGILNKGNGLYFVLVAYHENGVGHSVDEYEWNPGSCTMTYITTTTLSTEPANPRRISMDSHKGYAIAITWESKTDIYSKLYLASSGVLTSSITHHLYGPAIEPDVAFSHENNSPLKVNYVYLPCDPNRVVTGTAEVRQVDYWTEYASTAWSMASTLTDVNPLCCAPSHRIICNIDAPDHGWDNWAYAYTDDQNNIRVRLLNGVASTVVVNDASIPPQSFPINSVFNDIPTLSYTADGLRIMVGWFTSWSVPFESYVSAEITRDGLAMTSATDYLEIPFVPTNASGAPTLAFAKSNENTMNILYAFFSELNASGLYDMKHKYHPTASSGSFKKEHEHHCSDAEHIDGLPHEDESQLTVVAYPNPFANELSLHHTNSISGVVHVSVSDMSGRLLLEYNDSWSKVSDQLRMDSGKLETGLYVINVLTSGENPIEQNLQVQKL